MNEAVFKQMLTKLNADQKIEIKAVKAKYAEKRSALRLVMKMHSESKPLSQKSVSAPSFNNHSDNNHSEPRITRVFKIAQTIHGDFLAKTVAERMGGENLVGVGSDLLKLATRDHKLEVVRKGTGRFNPYIFRNKNSH